MSDDAAGKADTVAKETEGNGTTAGNAPGCSWEDIMKQYQKSGENAGTNAGYMPGMSFFPTAFMGMMPSMMPFTSMPFFPNTGAGGGSEAIAEAKDDGAKPAVEDDDATEDADIGASGPSAEVDTAQGGKRTAAEADANGKPNKRAKASKVGKGLAVKSNSDASLALLASTANQATMQNPMLNLMNEVQRMNEMLGYASPTVLGANAGGGGGLAGTANPLSNSAPKSDSEPHAGTAGRRASAGTSGIDDAAEFEIDEALLATMDEKDLKKLRRKQSNRESARRSRLRKQAEIEQLQAENQALQGEVQQLRNEKVELNAQIAILHAKLSMSSAFGALNGSMAALSHPGASTAAAFPVSTSLPAPGSGAAAVGGGGADAKTDQDKVNTATASAADHYQQ